MLKLKDKSWISSSLTTERERTPRSVKRSVSLEPTFLFLPLPDLYTNYGWCVVLVVGLKNISCPKTKPASLWARAELEERLLPWVPIVTTFVILNKETKDHIEESESINLSLQRFVQREREKISKRKEKTDRD